MPPMATTLSTLAANTSLPGRATQSVRWLSSCWRPMSREVLSSVYACAMYGSGGLGMSRT